MPVPEDGNPQEIIGVSASVSSKRFALESESGFILAR